MIRNDRQLKKAQETARNLQLVLEQARKTHDVPEYAAMSKPILLELQQRETEILRYLSLTETQASAL